MIIAVHKCCLFLYFCPITLSIIIEFFQSIGKMNYHESCKAYTSSNSPSWFENLSLEGYKMPITLNLPLVTS